MVRTQIYLTEAERAALADLASSRNTRQSELIREAIDAYLSQSSDSRRQEVLKKVGGMWRSRGDLPDFRRLRGEWDRSGQ